MTPPLSVATWKAVFASRKVQLLLVVTCIFIAGQFTEYPFIAARLEIRGRCGRRDDRDPVRRYGIAGVISSTVAASAIDTLGAPRTTRVALVFVIFGLAILVAERRVHAARRARTRHLGNWAAGPRSLPSRRASPIAADPNAASATVALNSSLLYAGQAIGTALGGWTLSNGHADKSGWLAVALIAIALVASIAAQRQFCA